MASSNEWKDSGPLELVQLSDSELKIILQIEERLVESRTSARTSNGKSRSKGGKPSYLAPVQDRYARVLLLDGGRGTGKTSLLLTLVHRWTPGNDSDVPAHDEDEEEYKKRVEKVRRAVQSEKASNCRLGDIPTNLKVIGRILDFDPLPPSMPLIAGIVQAWHNLAEEFDRLSGRPLDCDDDGETLTDLWHRLFQVAAVGWTAVPRNQSLLEHVLDRQEQVKDWHCLDQRWREFIDEVIQRGQCLRESSLSPDTVFVVMIDDIDLQVGRIRELLPALRSLYHPNVFFLVAADQAHMTDMLKLDFLGQQNKLVNREIREDSLRLATDDRWAGDLANSSFQKVFPLKNRWQIKMLSLGEILDFPPGGGETIKSMLAGWPQKPAEEQRRSWGDLGEYFSKMAGAADDPSELPPIMPYRTVHQIFEQAMQHSDPQRRALEVLRAIIGRADAEDLVRVYGRNMARVSSKESEAPAATDNGREDAEVSMRCSGKNTEGYNSKESEVAVSAEDDGSAELGFEYLANGKLVALFPEVLDYETGSDSRVVVSARPEFLFYTDTSEKPARLTAVANRNTEVISAVLAASLRDDGYGIFAPGLQWDIHLALAWTTVRPFVGAGLSRDFAFRWQLHEHPSPLRLLRWASDWSAFIKKLVGPLLSLERIAYGFIYYQLKWLQERDDGHEVLAAIDHPLHADVDALDEDSKDSWKALLELKPEESADKERWCSQTVPLLARPELGLKPSIQNLLLRKAKDCVEIKWLQEERRRLVTDAIVAAAEQAGKVAEDAENHRQEALVIEDLNRRYEQTYSAEPDEKTWIKMIEKKEEKSAESSEQ